MNLRISLNDKHESYYVTAFMQQIHSYGHGIEVILTKTDLINKDEPPTLDNLQFPRNLLSYTNRVTFEDGKHSVTLYEREVNKDVVIRRKPPRETTRE